MISGRKLLLADDSAAVQKVIELTFADEGMEVVSVGDGQSALDRLEYVVPDVVLADAFMPGLNGYELCRSMKDDERFSQIPVMLLISSFAPFDEAEAQRAGADDIMTKPFQSIRQLISRVDSLLNAKNTNVDVTRDQSSDEIGVHEIEASEIMVEVEPEQPNVTVMVEAAQLESAQPHEPHGGACAPDIEFQTADTARLDTAMQSEPGADTIEIEPHFGNADMAAPVEVYEYESDVSMNESLAVQPAPSQFSDALLDLDEGSFNAAAIDDDLILDLDVEASSITAHESPSWSNATMIKAPPEAESILANQPAPEFVSESEHDLEVPSVETAESQVPTLSQNASAAQGQTELSSEAIDAIARRVVEQMSEKVVREIAWEVVPELSELMIKKRLQQQ
ncbi:MAG TPA: response regulator [Pyrinomonadaceae bacterium]|nr:response regulator [Pyrinomonadaceae bacterium]